jgi:spore germination protein YaaH
MKLLRRILDREPRHRHASPRRAQPVPDLPPSLAANLRDGDTVERRRAAFPAAWRTRATAATTRARGAAGGHQHGQGRRRIAVIAAAFAVLMVMAGGTGAISSANGATRHDPAIPTGGNSVQASDHPSLNLPTATATPAPAPPSVASAAPLQSHEIFGYAPYWTLPESSSFDVTDLTTLAYFSVDANPNGTLDESGAGWNGYESQDLASLVTRAHAAGDRVVLTVTCFSQSALDTITSDPSAPATLSAALVNAVSAKNLDGVNFDFEGDGSADQVGLTSLITQVSHALHAANPHWQVTMATYASAAGDPSGFYNIAALAPAIDGFFVMAYDMNNRAEPSATAPLVGGGFNDTEALQQYTAVVPASKVILGVPYYGYDWPTTDGTSTAQATGGESPLSDGVIAASGHPTYWDPSTDTAWTSYQVGTQWHETFFDNPTSLAMKAQLANSYHIAGLGIWALGMDGNNPSMLAALLGNAPAAKDYTTGPTATTPTTAPAGTGFSSNGTYNGVSVPLDPINPPPPGGTAQYVGSLSAFGTTDPSLACLQTGLPLAVWSFSSLPGVYVVVAAQPQDCAAAIWSFTPPANQNGSGTSAPSSSTTSTDPGSSTSTTEPTSTTTTTTTSTSSTTTTTSSTTSTTTTTTTLP